MAMISKLSLAIFLLALALCSILAIGNEESEEMDPELKTCKHQCKQQRQYSEDDKRICMHRCDRYHQKKQEREKHMEEDIRGRKEREEEEKGKRHHHHHSEREEEEEEEEEENPYVLEDKDFDTRVDTEDGRVWILHKFKSKLLRGIENFRLSILEARGHTFMSPRHFDSETIFFNVKGQAIIGLVMEDKTERFNLEPGDIMRIPAGTPVYLVNRNENEKLFIASFHIPVSTPGNIETFFGPGGRDPESVIETFSWKVVEALLRTPRGELERLFDQQKKGSMFKITREHVHALGPKRSFWPFGGQSKPPFNLFSKRPSFSNQYGSLFEVGSFDEKSGLEGLNLMLTFTNITKGSMSTLLYNTHATKIALVIDGKGHFEMACPHLSSRSHSQKGSPSYHKISARLRPGMVFVVPAGHPFVTIASNRNNLMIICFEVNSHKNKKLTFAGKRNIVTALDRHAKELAFDYPAEKVDKIFDRDEEFFFPGPDTFEESEERGRADA